MVDGVNYIAKALSWGGGGACCCGRLPITTVETMLGILTVSKKVYKVNQAQLEIDNVDQ